MCQVNRDSVKMDVQPKNKQRNNVHENVVEMKHFPTWQVVLSNQPSHSTGVEQPANMEGRNHAKAAAISNGHKMALARDKCQDGKG
jgi:hypothetical protein